MCPDHEVQTGWVKSDKQILKGVRRGGELEDVGKTHCVIWFPQGLFKGGRHAAHLQAILLTLSASEESEGHVHSEKEGRGWTGLESSTYV